MKFTLYENAIDSINHGIEHFQIGKSKASKRDYKQAILLIFQGTELLLKSLLSQINVVLIFESKSLSKNCSNPSSPMKDEITGCRSINIMSLCEEVYKNYPNEFPSGSLKIVTDMAKIRNQIQHFGINLDETVIIRLLGQLYLEVISPSLNLIGNIITPDKNEVLDEEVQKVFSFFYNAENEEKVLNILEYKVHKGVCPNCNNYSQFMIYGDYGYPERTYCSSCEFSISNIDPSEFKICPECGANSLLYFKQKEYGVCLWYKCANHRDGGIPIELSPCEVCDDYIIEGECSCGYSEN